MKHVLAILAAGLLLAAPVASASAESWSGPVSKMDDRVALQSDNMMGPRHYAGARCRSEADAKDDAVEFCEGQLQCAQQSPPMTTVCTGGSRRWVCQCK